MTGLTGFYPPYDWLTLGAHAQRGLQKLSRVCVCVCLSEHAILAVRAIRSITKDAIVLSVRFAAILKRCFSLNCLIQKLERFSLTSAGAAIFSSCLLHVQCFVYSPLHVCLRVKHE